MVIADSRDLALLLLTAANNHADLVVKLSSLKQANDILSSLDSSSAAELFPYLAGLQRSPQSLVRKFVLESTLAVLGLASESHKLQPHMSTLHPLDTTLVQGATVS